jgi:deferrochelatase/peroxidase EfeB
MVTAGPVQTRAASDRVDLADVQGNILRGYRKARVRHLVVQVVDAGKARSWIGATVASDRSVAPAITRSAHWGERPPEVCFNLGVTFAGLKALRVPDSSANSFPEAFREGMAARASRLGDWGTSAPEHWLSWFRPGEPVHLIVTLYADTAELLDSWEQAMMTGLGGRAFRICGRNDGAWFNGDQVHFGYRDNISQPRFANARTPGKYDDQPTAPLGTVLLGYKTAFEELTWSLPDPHVLGFNGAFNAYRVLEQDVVAFEAFLDRAAGQLIDSSVADELLPPGSEAAFGTQVNRLQAMREVVAAKLLGRWRNGTPLELSPHDPAPKPPVSDTAFDYNDDTKGLKCPVGAHARRSNPRGGKIVQRVSNHTRRLVRRGVPYGPQFDPARPDGIERGLVANFLCASLAAQFEAVQYDWINLGLQDPRITGSNDPLAGANQEDAGWFDIPTSQEPVRLRGVPRFVRTRGGAYTFLPSISALRWIGSI